MSERGKREIVDKASFCVEMAAGISSEAGFVAVVKRKLLAFVAIAEREAGLLTEWESGARKIVFECIDFLYVVE